MDEKDTRIKEEYLEDGQKICNTCEGTGICPNCAGHGYIILIKGKTYDDIDVPIDEIQFISNEHEPCPECWDPDWNPGFHEPGKCPDCEGNGWVEE